MHGAIIHSFKLFLFSDMELTQYKHEWKYNNNIKIKMII